MFDDNLLIYGHVRNFIGQAVPPEPSALDQILVLPSYGTEIQLSVLRRNAFENSAV